MFCLRKTPRQYFVLLSKSRNSSEKNNVTGLPLLWIISLMYALHCTSSQKIQSYPKNWSPSLSMYLKPTISYLITCLFPDRFFSTHMYNIWQFMLQCNQSHINYNHNYDNCVDKTRHYRPVYQLEFILTRVYCIFSSHFSHLLLFLSW